MRRAELHLNALRRELRRIEARKPYSMVGKFDPQTSDCVFRFNLPRDPSLRWGVIVGDIVQNLRATLDHLVYALSEITTPSPTSTGFPIFVRERRSKPRDRAYRPDGERMIQHVPRACKPFFKLYQPYQRPNGPQGPDYHILEVLRVLSNDDKHRVMPAMAVAPFTRAFYDLVPVRDVESYGTMAFNFDVPIEHNAEAGRVSVVPNGTNPEMKVEADFALHIELRHPKASLDGRTLINLLEVMGVYISNILETFEPAFRGSPPVLVGRI